MFPEGEQQATEAAPSRVPKNSDVQRDDTPKIVMLLVASVVELISAGRECDQDHRVCKDELLLAVLVGLISIFFCILYLIYNKFASSPNRFIGMLFALIFIGNWTVGAGVTTFKRPFTVVSNGYFSSWLAFAVSCYFANSRIPLISTMLARFKEKGQNSQDYFVVFILLAASVVVLVHAITLCEDPRECENEAAWAVAVGVVTTALATITLLLSALLSRVKVYLAVLIALIWIPGCGILTFDYAPFMVAGNGYFGCWIAFFSSLYWAYLELVERFPQLRPASAQ